MKAKRVDKCYPFYPVISGFDLIQSFSELFELLLPVFQLCLVEEDILNALEEVIPHAVIFRFVAEAAAGLQIVQIICPALGKRNDMVDRVFAERNEFTADAAVPFRTVIDLIALLLGEDAPFGFRGGDGFGTPAPCPGPPLA